MRHGMACGVEHGNKRDKVTEQRLTLLEKAGPEGVERNAVG